MKTIHTSIIALSLLFALFAPIASAQDTAKLNLPEGAKLRLGNGTLGEIAYFPDGTRFCGGDFSWGLDIRLHYW